MDLNAVDLAARLGAFNAAHAPLQQNQAPEPVPTAPTGMQSGVQRDLIQEKIDKFLQNVPVIEGPDEKYKDVPIVSESLNPLRIDFPDDTMINEVAIVLEHVSDEQIAALGRIVLPMMAGGFSQQGVGAIFHLAYHLRDPSDGEYIFQDDITVINANDKLYTDLSAQVMSTNQDPKPPEALADIKAEARAYAYLAASTLRLFTKSEDNYIKAFQHIQLSYQKFYRHTMPVSVPMPTLEGIKTLTHCFSQVQIFKSTLYRMLYMGGGTKRARGLRRALYEMHLANTGLHIVGIFVKLCSILNCTPGLLLAVIYTKEFERQISGLVSILKLITNTDGQHTRKMWRYGRLFDSTFYSQLRTKSCPLLVYTLASALRGEAAESNKDILNIVQLAEVSPDRRRACAAAGEMVVKIIRAQIKESNVNGGQDPVGLDAAQLPQPVQHFPNIGCPDQNFGRLDQHFG